MIRDTGRTRLAMETLCADSLASLRSVGELGERLTPLEKSTRGKQNFQKNDKEENEDRGHH